MMLQTVKPRARWLSPGNVIVTHPDSPEDGWIVMGLDLDQAVRDWFRLTLKSMLIPVPAGTVVPL